MSRAHEIEDRAAHWLMRREEPDWSAAEQAEFEAWLAESMAHKACFWRLEDGWQDAERIGALGASAKPSDSSSQPGPLPQKRRWTRFAIAASALAAIGLGTVQFYRNSPASMADTQFATRIGGHRTVPLSDGSKVELNTATALRASLTSASRDVWLDRGEAYFEVAHRAGQPFVVHAGAQTVTVLGTKFSVRREADHVTVSVIEGRVRIDNVNRPSADRAVIITGGDIAVSHGPSTLLTERSPEKMQSALAWRNGVLSFDQSTLTEVAAEFNRYNPRQIVITDPKIAGMKIGGTFQASNVEAFIWLLREVYGLHVEFDGATTKISS